MAAEVIKVPVEGPITKIAYARNGGASFDFLREHSEIQYFEEVHVIWEGKRRKAYVDEDDKLKNLPVNGRATSLTGMQHLIVGTMFIWVPVKKEV